ncbi:hypothetical protein ACIGZJ_30820 [Kitasatospora sp. NPDC052868]|uniref:hypothetical protein n=1 Tax=Kitasatospora sp. NPDC052868 TaxID=3364060 RepID=UPI0037C86EB1
MTRSRTPRMCLLHADYHPLDDDCLAAVVDHTRRHPQPFSRAAHDDYQQAVERGILDRHIRQHLEHQEDPVPAYDPDGEPAPAPQGEELEQAA